jgi:hypothetical protein
MPESKDAVSVTEDRKGKKPTKVLSVDIEEALNAGHAAELSSDMQLWAAAVGIAVASNTPTAVDAYVCGVLRRLGLHCHDRVLSCVRRAERSDLIASVV